MKKRGFTLIELLAVIVILAIIALIATPLVLNTIDEAKQGAAKASATSYIEAIESKVASSLIKNEKYEDKEDYAYDEIEVDIKGAKPTGGIYSLKNGIVTSGVFCIDGYEINYANNKTEVQGKCTGEELKLSGSVKLSESSGYYTYPTSGTFEVTENISGGILSCTSSDEEVATCSISGTTVTVTPGTKEGTATLTIKSEGSSKYKEAQAAYLVTTKEGLLSYTVSGYDGVYDGESHGITVQASGATIKYGTEEGIYTLDESPTYTDVGIYTVYYQVSKAGYTTIKESKTVVIEKKDNTLTLSSNSGSYTYPTSGTFTVTGNTSGGTLSCSSNNTSVATCSISGTTVTVTPGTTAGSATLTVTSAATTNYNAGQAAYVATTASGTLSVTVNGYSGTYDGAAHGITVTSSGATITYSTSSTGTYSSTNPTYTNAGTYTVYYKVEKAGYTTKTGSATVVISKASGSATLSATSGTVYKGYTGTFTVSNATGTLSCSTSSSSVATCSVSGTTVTVTGVADGTATITVNVAEATNYTATSKTYTATVKTLLSSDVVSVGDYVSMTPTSTSYTVPASLTGYTSDQTINPSELNLWRVIRINSDGTIEMVSENASTTFVYFTGQTGYKNFVGALNTIAKQYENSTYTVGSRHMGYNGQTEYLTNTANTVDSTSTTAPWTSSTGSSTVESQGGGDILYTTDTDLVTNVLGTLVANDPSGTAKTYWLASRYYGYYGSSTWFYFGRSVYTSGDILSGRLYNYSSGFIPSSSSGAVRPIVTLKSGLTATGSGTSSSPWVLG